MSVIRTLQYRIQQGRDEGFTLIELLITVIILGVLAGIVVFAVSGVTDDSKTSACKADKKNVEIATEAYYAKNKAWPTAIDGTANTTLVGSGLLREAPSTSNGYTISLNTTTGAITSTGVC